MEISEQDRKTIDDIIERIRAKGKQPTVFLCGGEKAADHECDLKGPVVDVESGMGAVQSSSCSVCGKPAFNRWSIWDV